MGESRLMRIAYGCDTDSDADQTRQNLQAMVDRLNAETKADGWAGVHVAELYSSAGSVFIEIEPGEDVLCLELLRAVRARQAEARGRREAEPQQRSML